MHSTNLMRIVDHEELRRDLSNGAVVDVDSAGYQRYLQAKNTRRQQQERVEVMETRINNMESDIADIKNLLIRLLEK